MQCLTASEGISDHYPILQRADPTLQLTGIPQGSGHCCLSPPRCTMFLQVPRLSLLGYRLRFGRFHCSVIHSWGSRIRTGHRIRNAAAFSNVTSRTRKADWYRSVSIDRCNIVSDSSLYNPCRLPTFPPAFTFVPYSTNPHNKPRKENAHIRRNHRQSHRLGRRDG